MCELVLGATAMKRRSYTLRSLILLTTLLGLLLGLVAVPTRHSITLINQPNLKTKSDVYLSVLFIEHNDDPNQARNFNAPPILVHNLQVVEARQGPPAEVTFRTSAIVKFRLWLAGDSNLAVVGGRQPVSRKNTPSRPLSQAESDALRARLRSIMGSSSSFPPRKVESKPVILPSSPRQEQPRAPESFLPEI